MSSAHHTTPVALPSTLSLCLGSVFGFMRCSSFKLNLPTKRLGQKLLHKSSNKLPPNLTHFGYSSV